MVLKRALSGLIATTFLSGMLFAQGPKIAHTTSARHVPIVSVNSVGSANRLRLVEPKTMPPMKAAMKPLPLIAVAPK